MRQVLLLSVFCRWRNWGTEQSGNAPDRVQDMLPQNMGPWHIEYFKQEEFEKAQVQGRPPKPSSPLKQVIRPSCEGCLPVPRRQEHPCLWSKRDAEENLQELAASLSLPHLTHTLFCPITLFHDILLFIKPGKKMFKFNHIFESSFPYEGSPVMWNLD